VPGPDLLTTEVEAAAAALAAGGLVAIPTETVYGLGADADSPDAVGRIYAVKGRPPTHPVIVHVAGAAALDTWARDVPDYAHRLAEQCWPGPLTLVLPRTARAGDHVTGGADTVGLRAPSHPLTHRLLEVFGGGVAAPSANRFGRVSSTTARHVLDELGGLLLAGRDLVLDGGACSIGLESTIVDATGPTPRLLRPGAVDVERLTVITGLAVDLRPGGARAPGTLPVHYAPVARVVPTEVDALDATLAQLLGTAGAIGLLAPATVPDPPFGVRRLASPVDADAYAHVLYDALRRADDERLVVVVAVLPPEAGVGAAVRDRLRRAAAGSSPDAP